MSRRTRRQTLQAKLQELCPHVYFQPPASISMSYPCFVFSYQDDTKFHADDKPYFVFDRYSITYITKEAYPTDVLDALDAIRYCDFDRHYTSDNLHHFSYRIVLSERIQND